MDAIVPRLIQKLDSVVIIAGVVSDAARLAAISGRTGLTPGCQRKNRQWLIVELTFYERGSDDERSDSDSRDRARFGDSRID